jgi:CubicO group peptidase (beta-lactamase class C family)
MFFDSDLSLQQVRQKFGMLKPLYSFRGRWGYTNAAFMTAGEIIPRATKKSWAEFMRDSIFIPLEMNRTLALSKDILPATNKASAHTVVDGVLKKIPYGHIDNLAPAGSISSSVNDMSHWMMLQIDNGKYKGKQVIPEAALANARTPHSILGNGGSLYNRGHFALYGLGWFLEEYAGRKVQSHTGGVNGFVTSVTLLREEKLGILVFTNTDANNFYEALKWEIMDAYLGLPYRNYSQVYLGFHQNNEDEKMKQIKAKRDTIRMNLPASLPLKFYSGNYVHPVYGNMTISYEDSRLTGINGKLFARFEHHKGRFAELEPLGGNRFLATFNDPLYGIKVWPFTIANGKVRSVTVTVADFVEFTPYEFVKK